VPVRALVDRLMIKERRVSIRRTSGFALAQRRASFAPIGGRFGQAGARPADGHPHPQATRRS
jgi:hypothetical protein